MTLRAAGRSEKPKRIRVPGNPEVALAAAGGGPLGGSMLLTRT